MSSGNVDGALDVIRNIDRAVPGLAVLKLRQISIQRRHCNFDEVSRLYEGCIEESETRLQERSFYCIKFARYLAKVSVLPTDMTFKKFIAYSSLLYNVASL